MTFGATNTMHWIHIMDVWATISYERLRETHARELEEWVEWKQKQERTQDGHPRSPSMLRRQTRNLTSVRNLELVYVRMTLHCEL